MIGYWKQDYFIYIVSRMRMVKKEPQSREAEIYQKLSTVKDKKEFVTILKSVQNQNKKLISEIKTFKEKIEDITRQNQFSQRKAEQQKKNLENKQKEIEGQVRNTRKQLSQKYKIMKELKSQLAKGSESKIEEIEIDKMNNINQINNTERNITQLKKELIDLNKVHQKLLHTQTLNEKQAFPNQPRILELQEENKKLREEMSGIRKNDYEQLGYSIEVQEKLVKNRQKFRENSLKTLKSQTLPQIVSEPTHKNALEQLKKLQIELNQLKEKVAERQDMEEADLNRKRQQKNELIILNRSLIKQQKQLQVKKVKVIQENNSWKKKWQNILRYMEALKNKVKTFDIGTQYEQYEDKQPLRRDYAGIINQIQFDDRKILQEDKNCKIIGMLIYEIERGIVTIQSIYSNGLRSYIPIPQHYLQRCRITRVESSSPDFFKLFKIKYNSVENRIKKVEVRSNKNIKYQYGEKKAWNDIQPGDMIYGFDIGIKEYPVCVFGSYSYHKGTWFLEGFGVEINELDD